MQVINIVLLAFKLVQKQAILKGVQLELNFEKRFIEKLISSLPKKCQFCIIAKIIVCMRLTIIPKQKILICQIL